MILKIQTELLELFWVMKFLIIWIKGLPNDTGIKFNGAAGQSFGAFTTRSSLIVNGNTNDYFGKGLSGAKIIVKVPKEADFKSNENIITGNVALYGTAAGEAYINGIYRGEVLC